MKKITLGKEGTQPFKIKGNSVSREHAEISIDDNGVWILTDKNSMNGTFVRDEQTGILQRISQIEIHPMTFICLGADNSHGSCFYARQVLDPGNYDAELAYMNEKEDEYEQKTENLDKKAQRIKEIVFIVNVIIVVISCMGETGVWLLRGGTIISTFFSAFYDASKEKKKIQEKYDRFRHCPNPECSHKMKPIEIRSMDCIKCHCQ